jgi:hypothetical protein
MDRSKRTRPEHLSPLLLQVTEAIAHHAKHGTNLVPGDLFAALTELADIARVSVLSRGIVASDDFRSAVDKVAVRHLERAKADRALRLALDRITLVHQRNAVEVAHTRVLDLGELAHYYAGLASGLTLVDLGRR